MSILQYVLGVGWLWIVGFYVPDVFLEAGLQVKAGLTHIWKVAGFTGQTVDPTFVVGWNVSVDGWFCELCYLYKNVSQYCFIHQKSHMD